jgi:membrane fusion protein (multidrug efflux system)
VARVLVDGNQWVAKGDVLVELDPRDFEVRLAGAQAALQVARAGSRSADINVELTTVTSGAGLAQATAGVSVAEAGVEAARVGVDVAQAQLADAQEAVTVAQAMQQQSGADVSSAEAQDRRDAQDLQRYEALFADHTVSQQQLDHAQAAASTSQANLEAARKRGAASQAQVGQAQTAVKAAEGRLEASRSAHVQAQSALAEAKARQAAAGAAPQEVAMSKAQADVNVAEVAQAQAAVDQAGLALSYAKITAPEAGRVTNKMVEEGAYVQVGQALMTLVPAHLWVVANFKETQLVHIQPGQPATVKVDAYPGKVFQAHVDSVQAGTGAAFSLLPPENATGYFVKVVQRVPVKIVFDEQPDPSAYHLGPGMSVVPTVDISAAPAKPAQAPEAAVR